VTTTNYVINKVTKRDFLKKKHEVAEKVDIEKERQFLAFLSLFRIIHLFVVVELLLVFDSESKQFFVFLMRTQQINK